MFAVCIFAIAEDGTRVLVDHRASENLLDCLKNKREAERDYRDPEKRIHIPIITNPGCRMVIEDESYHMPADGSAYITDNTKYHNFFNGGETDRLHLVATLIE